MPHHDPRACTNNRCLSCAPYRKFFPRQLTADELEQSQNAPTFESVKPQDIFGPKADPNLAMRVQQNPVRFRELRLEYLYESGQLRRADSDYDSR
jgi:hypothetical protein